MHEHKNKTKLSQFSFICFNLIVTYSGNFFTSRIHFLFTQTNRIVNHLNISWASYVLSVNKNNLKSFLYFISVQQHSWYQSTLIILSCPNAHKYTSKQRWRSLNFTPAIFRSTMTSCLHFWMSPLHVVFGLLI